MRPSDKKCNVFSEKEGKRGRESIAVWAFQVEDPCRNRLPTPSHRRVN